MYLCVARKSRHIKRDRQRRSLDMQTSNPYEYLQAMCWKRGEPTHARDNTDCYASLNTTSRSMVVF